jgi:hypothetical protein
MRSIGKLRETSTYVGMSKLLNIWRKQEVLF